MFDQLIIQHIQVELNIQIIALKAQKLRCNI